MLTEVSLNVEFVTAVFTLFLVSRLLLEVRSSSFYFGGSRGVALSHAVKRSLLGQRIGKRSVAA